MSLKDNDIIHVLILWLFQNASRRIIADSRLELIEILVCVVLFMGIVLF